MHASLIYNDYYYPILVVFTCTHLQLLTTKCRPTTTLKPKEINLFTSILGFIQNIKVRESDWSYIVVHIKNANLSLFLHLIAYVPFMIITPCMLLV